MTGAIKREPAPLKELRRLANKQRNATPHLWLAATAHERFLLRHLTELHGAVAAAIAAVEAAKPAPEAVEPLRAAAHDALYEAVSFAGLAAHDLAGPMERENAKDTYAHAVKCIDDLAALSHSAPEMAPVPPHCPRHDLPQTRNPHPKAGDPSLEFGYEYQCIPCLVMSRRGWSERCHEAERKVAELSAPETAPVEADGVSKDAEDARRYRWLRDQCINFLGHSNHDDMDKAIDEQLAAMAPSGD